ncbi:DUF397 domain-containing protein [Streptomyces sp. NPDC007901]|uniref:DUF397 domain-containing protein n=1 Tax=Streptomyces sp. NPDC007901 TaxID=3364785 RepID=UPI0036F12CCE
MSFAAGIRARVRVRVRERYDRPAAPSSASGQEEPEQRLDQPGHEHTVTSWHKSSYSGGDQGECLEVARGHASGPALVFSADGWAAFVGAVRDGRISG